jgi:hypothetical protein
MFPRIPFDRVNWLVSSFLIGTLFLSVTAVPLYLWFFGCQVCAAAGWHNAERGSGKATSPRHGYPACAYRCRQINPERSSLAFGQRSLDIELRQAHPCCSLTSRPSGPLLQPTPRLLPAGATVTGWDIFLPLDQRALFTAHELRRLALARDHQEPANFAALKLTLVSTTTY